MSRSVKDFIYSLWPYKRLEKVAQRRKTENTKDERID
jgi:hypothetical protein